MLALGTETAGVLAEEVPGAAVTAGLALLSGGAVTAALVDEEVPSPEAFWVLVFFFLFSAVEAGYSTTRGGGRCGVLGMPR